jgi:tripartite-type tricarboxylate transporter receptor subunit TctC
MPTITRRARVARALGILAATLLAATPAAAQEAFPNRPVRFIVPFAPGGTNDFTARLMAPRMAAALGQPVVIETRSGAGGVTGVDVAAKAPPDGHTIVLGTAGSIVIGPLLRNNQPFDPLRDLAAVTLAINVQVPVVVPARSPYRTMQELLAAARANPGRITFGSSGTGSLPHLAGELIREAAGVEMVHVPYRGGAPLSLAVVAGEVEMGLSDLPVFMGPARDGALRILAVGSPQRLALLPEVPTLQEIGLNGVDTSNWHGVVTAAAVPPAILDRLHQAAAGALRDPEVVRAINGQGMEAVGNSRAEFAALIQSEVPRWAAVLRRANIRPE